MGTPPSCKYLVGYALTPKKTNSFLQPKLLLHARNNGFAFVAIDRNMPLEVQGPFDIILHKLPGKQWQRHLEAYSQKYSNVIILDPPVSIEYLRNRQSMLKEVVNLNLNCHRGKVGVPKQLVVVAADPALIPDSVAKAELKLPVVVKPLIFDGTEKSHAMLLAYSMRSLAELHPPLVLQEFINHGGLLFKVYVVGEHIKVARRFSLPDILEVAGSSCKGLEPFPRVSSSARSADGANLDPSVSELPPRELLESLARELRCRMGLSLFNLDIIRERGNRDSYYVIDINYFPGFGKMEDYELVFTDFLLNLVQSKRKSKGKIVQCRTECSKWRHQTNR